jgi:hypothetical protein
MLACVSKQWNKAVIECQHHDRAVIYSHIWPKMRSWCERNKQKWSQLVIVNFMDKKAEQANREFFQNVFSVLTDNKIHNVVIYDMDVVHLATVCQAFPKIKILKLYRASEIHGRCPSHLKLIISHPMRDALINQFPQGKPD